MSMALWGTVIGSLFGSLPCDRIGRKNTLIWIGILFFVSAIGSAIAWDPYSFSFFRFIGGIGVGASTVASPTYISEISNKESRGKLVALYQFNIVFGILIAYFSNYLFQGFGGDIDWRYMLGVEAIPAIFYILFVLKVPNSPRWLILFKGDNKKAEEKWKEEFKTHGELFKSQGVSIAYMGSADNKSVLAIFETDDLDKFNEIFDSEETAKAMSNDGIEKDSVEKFIITDQLVIM